MPVAGVCVTSLRWPDRKRVITPALVLVLGITLVVKGVTATCFSTAAGGKATAPPFVAANTGARSISATDSIAEEEQRRDIRAPIGPPSIAIAPDRTL